MSHQDTSGNEFVKFRQHLIRFWLTFKPSSSFTGRCTTYRTHICASFTLLKPHSWIKDSFAGFVCNQPAGYVHIFQKPTAFTTQQFTVIQKNAGFPCKTMNMPDMPEQRAIQYAGRLFIFFDMLFDMLIVYGCRLIRNIMQRIYFCLKKWSALTSFMINSVHFLLFFVLFP